MNQQQLQARHLRQVLYRASSEDLSQPSRFNSKLSREKVWGIFYDLLANYADHLPVPASFASNVIQEFGVPDPAFDEEAVSLLLVLEQAKRAANTFVRHYGASHLALQLKETVDLMGNEIKRKEGYDETPEVYVFA